MGRSRWRSFIGAGYTLLLLATGCGVAADPVSVDDKREVESPDLANLHLDVKNSYDDAERCYSTGTRHYVFISDRSQSLTMDPSTGEVMAVLNNDDLLVERKLFDGLAGWARLDPDDPATHALIPVLPLSQWAYWALPHVLSPAEIWVEVDRQREVDSPSGRTYIGDERLGVDWTATNGALESLSVSLPPAAASPSSMTIEEVSTSPPTDDIAGDQIEEGLSIRAVDVLSNGFEYAKVCAGGITSASRMDYAQCLGRHLGDDSLDVSIDQLGGGGVGAVALTSVGGC